MEKHEWHRLPILYEPSPPAWVPKRLVRYIEDMAKHQTGLAVSKHQTAAQPHRDAGQPAPLSITDLSRRWGIEDLNLVKRIADKNCREEATWLTGYTLAREGGPYPAANVYAYEGSLEERMLGERMIADLADEKAEG